MNYRESLHRMIAHDAAVAKVFGERVYSDAVPLEEPKPFCVFSRVSSRPQYTSHGENGIEEITVEVSVYASSRASADAGTLAIRRAIPARGPVRIQNEADTTIQPAEGDARLIFVTTMTLRKLHRKEAAA